MKCNIEENTCSGCIYDLTDRVVTDEEIFNNILDNCCACKRGVIAEYRDNFKDLYTKINKTLI